MSTESFEDFFFRVCTQDYSRMAEGMAALELLMAETDRVELKGPDCDLRFSIKGISAVACGGSHNIPDGEVFSCPVKESVEGEITYNVDRLPRHFFRPYSSKFGATLFKDVPTLSASTNFDSDGARYIGEFAIAFNPHIPEPMRDILFDEKIAGSFHRAKPARKLTMQLLARYDMVQIHALSRRRRDLVRWRTHSKRWDFCKRRTQETESRLSVREK